ncbi:MAG: hypothetical protein A3A33_05105 [Candidatus Yanofskybacteria bacterium RIFCSPLOWO2_01_FULL_49_25]|uniref:MOFRL-associated domain-containing protein n=1 Tax=Candidatus Yanofskybacteria bacterium RIFCSPLOWO2_01_FULL_49_25 TaxID=1802701 RepID=A0A1F8GUQ5_9BACT|nr:MAG: hypothetical protein A3A33_05105 [Candidatus Yanofskybacteria bacterium RIFCSPLOWO2_01_FULL_49_25]
MKKMGMNKMWIKNRDRLANSPEREKALNIVDVAFDAIDTEQIIQNDVKLEDGTLSIHGHPYNLKDFDRIFLIAFGKGAAQAATALHPILGKNLTHTIVLDKAPLIYDGIESYQGTHPIPSHMNLQASSRIQELAQSMGERDLALVVICGGGSALVCWPESECEQGARLYKSFLGSGGDIEELNIIRKHISLIKGGGLARMLFPATVVGMIFSDVLGDISEVASGPTYFDKSTVDDARAMLLKLEITEELVLNETPKDEKYFTKVSNFEMSSSRLAIEAMLKKARELGINGVSISEPIYKYAPETLKNLLTSLGEHQLVIAGGEIRLDVRSDGGRGGRCQYLGMNALVYLPDDVMLVAFATDGEDNSDVAGVIVDKGTKLRASKTGLDIQERLITFESYTTFEKTGDQIITGQTGANVSDIYLLYKLP